MLSLRQSLKWNNGGENKNRVEAYCHVNKLVDKCPKEQCFETTLSHVMPLNLSYPCHNV